MTDSLWRDLRLAMRSLRAAPGFAVAAVATLTLGIGATTAMFSVVNATLLRPLPFPDPDRLVTVWKSRVNDTNLNITSLPNYRDWAARSTSFESLALFDSAGRGYSLTDHGEPEQVSGVRVTASFFRVLGVPPLLGRTFLPEEEEPGNALAVVLSHGLWVRRYGGDSSLVGKTIQIDGREHRVVGVMPPHFRFQFWNGPRQLWVPAGWTRGDYDRSSNSFVAIGRLRKDVNLEEARAEMDGIGRGLASEYPAANPSQTVRLVPTTEYGIQELRSVLVALLGIVGFVLLIACVNVANLMLARNGARHHELAVQRALGAGRGRVARQLGTESLCLALLGGACGLLLAAGGTTLLMSILPASLRTVPFRPVEAIELDATVLTVTFALSILSAVVFGLGPALASLKGDLSHPLRDNGRQTTSAGRSRVRYALVSSEVALTLITMAGAGLLLVSVARLLAVDPGFDPHNVLGAQISQPQADLFYGPPDHPLFCANLDREVGSLPGVLSASAIAHLPLSGGGAGRGIAIEGRPDPGPEDQPGADYTVACPDLLRTMGIHLVAGREFTMQDTLGSPAVAIVNEAMASRFWPNESAVGKRFKIGTFQTDAPWLTVVGVHRNVRNRLNSESRAAFLRPYTQAGWPSMTIVVKAAASPQSLFEPVKKALAIVEPGQPISEIRTMDEVVAASISPTRFAMLLLGGFGLLALMLAAVGIAGVVGYSVVQRTPEIGIRIALGAQSRDVLRLLMGDSLWWTLGGVVAGLVGSLALLRSLELLLYGVTPTDPVVLAVVSVVLVGVALGATYIPARAAVRVDPVATLRRG